MASLLAATALWALSFGLIKGQLTGLDPGFVAFARLALALPLFLPLLRLRGLDGAAALRLALIGAVEYGVMYVGYNAAFRFAAAHEVALYTVLTPIYVALVHDAQARRFDPASLGLAALAVAGALVIKADAALEVALVGFALVQASNLCWAWGQVAYRKLRRERPEQRDREVFALLYLGGAAVTALAATATGGWASLGVMTGSQAWTLVYLGVAATGLGFFLWNRGAVQVGPSALAVCNNLKIPLAVLAALTLFGERADLLRLALGGGLMVLAAVLAARRGEA